MPAEKVIRKHVAIIHAYSLMSVLQRKIVNVLLYEATNNKAYINHKDSVAIECRVPFCSLVKAVSFNSNNTQYLKEAIDGLASLKIEWNLLKDKVPMDISFLNLRVLHGSPTFYQDGTFNFSFHKVMLELTNNPPIYGTIDLGIQAQFESKYGHSLYENSTRFVNLHKNKIIHLDTFRKLLGVDDNKYGSMREFTRNVIQPSLEEVNDRSDFTVKLNNVKAGRKIIGFELSVNYKKTAAPMERKAFINYSTKLHEEIKQTFGGLSETVLKSILHSYSEEYVFEKIIYTKKFAKKDHSGFYPIPYFISALRDNYKSSEEIEVQAEVESKKINLTEDHGWYNKERELQADLIHWGKIMEHIQKETDNSTLINIQKIIDQCKEKLQKHYLEHPPIKQQVI